MPVEFARQFYLEDATTFEHAGGSWMRSAPELLERLVHLQRLANYCQEGELQNSSSGCIRIGHSRSCKWDGSQGLPSRATVDRPADRRIYAAAISRAN